MEDLHLPPAGRTGRNRSIMEGEEKMNVGSSGLVDPDRVSFRFAEFLPFAVG